MLYDPHLDVNKWKQFKTSLLLVYLVFVLAILGARWFADPVKPYRWTLNLARLGLQVKVVGQR